MQLNELGLDWKETDYSRNHTCYSTHDGLIIGRVSAPFTGANYNVFIFQGGVEKLYGNYINLNFAKDALVAKFLQDVNMLLNLKGDPF